MLHDPIEKRNTEDAYRVGGKGTNSKGARETKNHAANSHESVEALLVSESARN